MYYSETSHTRAMAQLVARGANSVKGIKVKLKSVDQTTADDLLWCDGVACGAPTHLGSIPWEMKRWWDVNTGKIWQKIDGKFACAFSSSGGLGGGPELTCLSLLIMMMNYGLLAFGVTDYVAQYRTLHYGAAISGNPDEQWEMDVCKRLGKRLSEWVAYYVDGKKDQHPKTGQYKRQY